MSIRPIGQNSSVNTAATEKKSKSAKLPISPQKIKKARGNIKDTFDANNITKRGLDFARAVSNRRYAQLLEELAPYMETPLDEQPVLKAGAQSIPLLDFCKIKNPKATIIFFHGVGENYLHNQKLYKKFLELGCRVIVPEYGGFGKHTLKNLDERNMKKYAKALNDYLKTQKIPQKQTILVSHSFGALPLSWLAQEIPNAKFAIIASPFHSFTELRNNLVTGKMWKLTPEDKKYLQAPGCVQHVDNLLATDSSKRLSKLKILSYIIHGDKDEIVPFPSSTELTKKTGLKLLTLKNDGHSLNELKTNKILKILKVILSDNFKIKRKRIFQRYMQVLLKFIKK